MKLCYKVSVTGLLMVIVGMCATVAVQQRNDMGKILSPEQHSIIGIAAYTATGNLPKLKVELNQGLQAGLTVSKVRESLIHLYAYCGFPRSLRGLTTLMEVLKEREAKGIIDDPGVEASPIQDNRSRYERGKAILEKLSGIKEEGPKTGYAAFAPQVEILLKEHLFADLFERDVLSYTERELVTIAVLSSIGGVEPMLTGHLNICLNIGFTPGQLQQFIGVLRSAVGNKKAAAAQVVLDEVIKNKQK